MSLRHEDLTKLNKGNTMNIRKRALTELINMYPGEVFTAAALSKKIKGDSSGALTLLKKAEGINHIDRGVWQTNERTKEIAKNMLKLKRGHHNSNGQKSPVGQPISSGFTDFRTAVSQLIDAVDAIEHKYNEIERREAELQRVIDSIQQVTK